MKPTEKRKTHAQPMMVPTRLELILNMEHELVKLAAVIDWAELTESFGQLYAEEKDRPGVLVRTVAGLMMLQRTFGLAEAGTLVGKG